MVNQALFNLTVVTIGVGCMIVAIHRGLFWPKEWLLVEPQGRQRRGMAFLIGTAGAFLVAAIVPAVVMRMAAGEGGVDESSGLPKSLRALAVGLFLGGVLAAAGVAGVWRVVRGVEGPALEKGVAVPGAIKGVGWAVVWMPVVLGVSVVATWVMVLLQQGQPPVLGHVLLGPMVDPEEPLEWRLMLMAAAVVVVPAVEEMVYRGLLLPGVVRATGSTWAGVIGSSAVFALVHWGSVPAEARGAAMATLFTLAVGLSLVHIRTRSILAPIAMHAGFNALNIAMALVVTGLGGDTPAPAPVPGA